MPSVDHRVAAALWGIFFALFLWGGMLLLGGISGATAFILGWLVGAGVFLFVLYFGGDERTRFRR